jgi:hypothetical protein
VGNSLNSVGNSVNSLNSVGNSVNSVNSVGNSVNSVGNFVNSVGNSVGSARPTSPRSESKIEEKLELVLPSYGSVLVQRSRLHKFWLDVVDGMKVMPSCRRCQRRLHMYFPATPGPDYGLYAVDVRDGQHLECPVKDNKPPADLTFAPLRPELINKKLR